jgi:hypothetical protein
MSASVLYVYTSIVFYILSTSPELSRIKCTLHHIYARSYFRVIGFHPEAKCYVEPRLSQSVLTRKWLCHINQFSVSITLHQIGFMEFYLAFATACLIPVNSWGFHHIRKWNSTEGCALFVKLTLRFLLSSQKRTFIHSFIHSSFISYIQSLQSCCIALHGSVEPKVLTLNTVVQNAEEP